MPIFIELVLRMYLTLKSKLSMPTPVCTKFKFCMLSICLLLTGVLNASIVDSLAQSIDAAATSEQKLESILRLINTADKEVLPYIDKYKKEAFAICQSSHSNMCYDKIYNITIGQLILFGESKKAKSWIHEWQSMSESNGNKKAFVKSKYYLASILYDEGAHDLFLSHLQEAKSVLVDLPDEKELIYDIDVMLAIYYRDIGAYEKAAKYFKNSLAEVKSLDKPLLLSNVYNHLGRLYRKKSEYDSARIFYYEALDIAKSQKNLRQISSLNNNLGNIYHVEGSLELALTHYIESKNVKEKINYPKGICIAYHNIGAVRFDLHQYEEALIDFNKSLDLSYELNHKVMQIHNLLKIGNVYRLQSEIAKAIANHTKSLKISKEINSEQGLIESNIYLGEDYLAKKDFITAYKYFKRSLELAETNDRKNFISASLVFIAQSYMGLHESNDRSNASLDYKLASSSEIEDLLIRGVTIAEEIDSYSNIVVSLEALRKFYRTQGEYKKEADISNSYLAYRDSLYEKQSAIAIAELSTQYETKEKEKEIALLQKENELQQVKSQASKNRLIGFLIFILLASIGLLTAFYLNHKVKRVRQIENLRTKISSDLHDDVGSILSGLSMRAELLEMNSPESTKPELQLISKLGRNAMQHMRDAVWAMDARKDNMSDLIDRMREFAEETLGAKEINFDFVLNNLNLESKIRPDYRQNIYLIFKEAVANIVKHSNADEVKLNLYNEKGTFHMQIIDNGNTEAKTYKTTGLGTDNMKMRAKRIAANIMFKREMGYGVYIEVPAF